MLTYQPVTNMFYCQNASRGSYPREWHWNLFLPVFPLFLSQKIVPLCVSDTCSRHVHAKLRSALTTDVLRSSQCFAALPYFSSNNLATGALTQVQFKVLLQLSSWKLIRWPPGLPGIGCLWLCKMFTNVISLAVPLYWSKWRKEKGVCSLKTKPPADLSSLEVWRIVTTFLRDNL